MWIAPRGDEVRDAQRKRLKLPPLGIALDREMNHDEGRPDWTVSASDTLGRPRESFQSLLWRKSQKLMGVLPMRSGRMNPFCLSKTYSCDPAPKRHRRRDPAPAAERRRSEGKRRASKSARDPTTVAIDDALRSVAAPGDPPKGLDDSKKDAWEAITAGKSISVVVGPPGVGKTYLVAQLLKSILLQTPSARILVSSQNHETLIAMEHELKKELAPLGKIVVRVQKSDVDTDATLLRQNSRNVLETISHPNISGALINSFHEIRVALKPTDETERAVSERVLRDTDNLLLRSADVTLATTSSPFVEDMIADGEQFDWVFVEEAARANGTELIGSLLLGNRRVMIGDHRQLSPFEVAERKKIL